MSRRWQQENSTDKKWKNNFGGAEKEIWMWKFRLWKRDRDREWWQSWSNNKEKGPRGRSHWTCCAFILAVSILIVYFLLYRFIIIFNLFFTFVNSNCTGLLLFLWAICLLCYQLDGSRFLFFYYTTAHSWSSNAQTYSLAKSKYATPDRHTEHFGCLGSGSASSRALKLSWQLSHDQLHIDPQKGHEPRPLWITVWSPTKWAAQKIMIYLVFSFIFVMASLTPARNIVNILK